MVERMLSSSKGATRFRSDLLSLLVYAWGCDVDIESWQNLLASTIMFSLCSQTEDVVLERDFEQ